MSKTRCFTQVKKGKATIQGSGGAYARSACVRHVCEILGDARRGFRDFVEDFGTGPVTAGYRVTAAPGRRATSDRQRSQRVPAAPRFPVSAIREVL